MYNSNIIGFATNGAINYAEESKRENEILDHTASILESAISNIGSMNSGTSGSTGDGGDEEEPEVGIDFGDMSEEEFINNYVGQYVEYTPISGTFSDHVESTYSGDTLCYNQQISTDTSVRWKILFVDSNILTLISDKAVHDEFYLENYNGYNNGVLLLDNACKTMYSNSSLEATVRNLKIEDIESVSSYGGASNQEYSPSYRYYPNIFDQEAGGAPNGTYGSLGRSEQISYITGNASGNSSFKGKQTYYKYTISSGYMNQKYVNIFNCSPTSWLASRCVHYDGNYAHFGMFYVSGRRVDANWLYGSGNSTGNYGFALRPIVEIDLTKVNVGVTGTGADGDGYSLTLK